VVEARVDGYRSGWTGDVGADDIAYIGRLDLLADALHVTLTLRHPSLGEVTSSYDDVMEWLRIVSG
jgi:hypothetical protein